MIIAFLTVGTMGLSNTSLGYLNYPTQVIFKCCKLIPVMLGGVFIQGIVMIYFHTISNLQAMLLSSSIGKNIQLPLIHLVNSLAYLTVLIVCTQHIRKSRGCLRAVLVPETNILSLGKRRSWFCNCCNFSHFGSYCFCSITVFTYSEVPGSAECSHSPVLWSATFSPLHSALSQGKAWSEQSCFCD